MIPADHYRPSVASRYSSNHHVTKLPTFRSVISTSRNFNRDTDSRNQLGSAPASSSADAGFDPGQDTGHPDCIGVAKLIRF